jgi:hypothetical protein
MASQPVRIRTLVRERNRVVRRKRKRMGHRLLVAGRR